MQNSFSIIIPLYNRPDEIQELLETLITQTNKNFEVVIVEDGSTIKSDKIVEEYTDRLDIQYFFKPNTGPGMSRNFGFEKAKNDYFIILDSDVILPEDYIQNIDESLQKNPLDAFGGPDAAHESFSDIQKAINYAMTSFITTGGIRGKKTQLDKFQPRSFNMGMRKSVFEDVGGFSKLHPGEDPDLSYRIMEKGYKTGLIPDAVVFHKRRIDFSKFTKQVYKFGVVRNILSKWHEGTSKLVYFLPTLFLLGSLFLVLISVVFNPLFLTPLAGLLAILLLDSLRVTKSIKIAAFSVLASFIQLYSYGLGFLHSFIMIRMIGKDERKYFTNFFFKD